MDSHSSYLLQQLQEQRIQGLLCDCMIVVKGVCFKAHKNVLAAFSSYFRSLFQASPTQKSDIFNLGIQDVSGIGQILDYFYTSHLDINQDNVRSLLDIAHSLQVPNVQNMCTSFLRPASAPPAASLELALSKVSEQECVLGNAVFHDVEPNLDLDQARKFSSNGDVPGGTQVPVERQLVHGYKLRNFYSKQYFKQISSSSLNPGLGSVCEVQPTLGVSNLVRASSPWTSVEKSASVAPSYNLNNLDFKQTNTVISNPTPEPGSEAQVIKNVVHNSTLSASNPVRTPSLWTSTEKSSSLTPADDLNAADTMRIRPVRPKKAVYLKKYNYHRSQEALEEMCVEATSANILCPQQTVQVTTVVQPAVSTADQRETEVNQCDMETQTNPHNPSLSLNPEEQPGHHEEQGLDPFPTPPQHPPQMGQRQYNCPHCGKIFKHPSNLELHKRSHTGEKPFQCNICGRHFSQAGNLQTHLRRHAGEKPYICELCGKSFTASGDVQRHKVVHSGERPHLCDICGRGFNNLSNLKEHKRTHSTEKSFTCDECGKSFNTHRKLLKHRARHLGEKPHSCATCGKSFVGSGDLQRHIRCHTGEKPYGCQECGKSFSRSAMLRRHRQMHCRGKISRNSTTKPKTNPHTFASMLPLSPSHISTTNMAALPGTTNMSSSSALGAQTGMKNMSTGPKTTNMSTNPKTTNMSSNPGTTSMSTSSALGPAPTGTTNMSGSPETMSMAASPAEQQSLVPPLEPRGQSTQPLSLSSGSSSRRSLPKSTEGQLMSSVTLWGLAMKTLQNTDLE